LHALDMLEQSALDSHMTHLLLTQRCPLAHDDSSVLVSQSLSMLSHFSDCGPITFAHEPHLPALQVRVPGLHGRVLLPWHGSVSPS
jgi:hypothetical protein